MTTRMRYDRSVFRAQITEDGYLIDTPIVARTGIQLYRRADGTTRRELRRPEDVFHPDSLASYAGKPITFGHPPERVTAKNFKKYAIGVMPGVGMPDAENVKASIIVHDAESVDKATKGGIRELSLGYTVVLDETPGMWEGQEYDAIQTKIDINHLSVVPRGRAGNARLNLDRLDAESFNSDEEINMSTDALGRLRLDSGLEYQAAPEIVVAYEKLRKDVADVTKKLDSVSAERDTLKAQVESAEKVRADALEAARKEVKERAELDKIAESFNVDVSDKSDREVKELVIKTLRADVDLSGKSDEYINAAFDMTVSVKKDVAMAAQRQAGARKDSGAVVAKNDYKSFMSQLGKKEAK